MHLSGGEGIRPSDESTGGKDPRLRLAGGAGGGGGLRLDGGGGGGAGIRMGRGSVLLVQTWLSILTFA